jgi:hypothetical protein
MLVPGTLSLEIISCSKDAFMSHRLVGKIGSLELGTSGVSPGLQKDRFHAAGHAEITISHPTSDFSPHLDNT